MIFSVHYVPQKLKSSFLRNLMFLITFAKCSNPWSFISLQLPKVIETYSRNFISFIALHIIIKSLSLIKIFCAKFKVNIFKLFYLDITCLRSQNYFKISFLIENYIYKAQILSCFIILCKIFIMVFL